MFHDEAEDTLCGFLDTERGGFQLFFGLHEGHGAGTIVVAEFLLWIGGGAGYADFDAVVDGLKAVFVAEQVGLFDQQGDEAVVGGHYDTVHVFCVLAIPSL